MKHAPVLAAPLAALLLAAGCGSESGDTASDPAGTSGTSPTATPTAGIPPATRGEVSTRGLVTVIDAGDPEVCLGPVAESDPPQCDGIPLQGWHWPGDQRTSGGVRWGEYLVTGTFDGTRLTVTGAVGAAAYDPGTPDGRPDGDLPGPDAATAAPGTQQEVLHKLREHPLPGTLSTYPGPPGVVVDVVHDDGSLQAQVDAAYGAGVVTVRSMLVPVNR